MKPFRMIRLLVYLWIGVILINSLLPGDLSSLESGYVVDVMFSIFDFFGYTPDIMTLHQVIRMTAHFVEFMILGILLAIDFRQLHYPWYKLLIVILVIALLDETIQIYTPGRAFELMDIVIDLLGGTLGYLLIRYILRKDNRKKTKHLKMV